MDFPHFPHFPLFQIILAPSFPPLCLFNNPSQPPDTHPETHPRARPAARFFPPPPCKTETSPYLCTRFRKRKRAATAGEEKNSTRLLRESEKPPNFATRISPR